MQIRKPVQLPRRPGTGSQQYSNQNSSFQLSIHSLIWILHYSSDEHIIQMVADNKFEIMNLLIGSWEERFALFWHVKAIFFPPFNSS